MPDTPSVIIVKEFQYRGEPEEWSNRYHFIGFTPGSTADWQETIRVFIDAEQSITGSEVKFVRAYGYSAGSDHANYVVDFTTPGPPETGSMVINTPTSRFAGDQAAVVRWSTGLFNSRGKQIYCWKYIHGGVLHDTEPDRLDPSYITALQNYAQLVAITGLPGGMHYSHPQGQALTNPYVDQYVTTRTLKRRGKRPLPQG